MRGMYLRLSGDEKDALVKLSERERRDPRAQAALLIRQRLEDLGLLPATDPSQSHCMEATDVSNAH